MKLKLMTYNIWGGQSYNEYLSGVPEQKCTRDVAPVAAVIKESGAEVVALNEIFNCTAYGNQAEQIANLAGFPYYHFAHALERSDIGGFYGNALLSKYPIVKTEEKIIPAETGVRFAEQRAVLCATLDLGEKYLDVIVSHFGLIQEEKQRAADAVLDFKIGSDNACVFMGDMNSIRESVHAERLKTSFSIANEKDELVTWPAEYTAPERQYFSSPLWNRQIDYIFVSDGISVSKTEAIYSLASDHKALYADVEI